MVRHEFIECEIGAGAVGNPGNIYDEGKKDLNAGMLSTHVKGSESPASLFEERFKIVPRQA